MRQSSLCAELPTAAEDAYLAEGKESLALLIRQIHWGCESSSIEPRKPREERSEGGCLKAKDKALTRGLHIVSVGTWRLVHLADVQGKVLTSMPPCSSGVMRPI